MAAGTFIKLYRSLTSSAVFMDAELLRLWIYILCHASYEEKDVLYDGIIVHLLPGEIVTGRKNLANILRTAESKVYRMLMQLKKLGNVNIKANNRFSVISIVNWDFYQGTIQKTNSGLNSGLNSERTANEQQG